MATNPAAQYNPWAAAATAAADALKAPPAGPSDAKGGSIGGSGLDGSAWNVTFGNNSGINAGQNKTPLAGLAGGLGAYLPYVVGAVILLKLWKRKN